MLLTEACKHGSLFDFYNKTGKRFDNATVSPLSLHPQQHRCCPRKCSGTENDSRPQRECEPREWMQQEKKLVGWRWSRVCEWRWRRVSTDAEEALSQSCAGE